MRTTISRTTYTFICLSITFLLLACEAGPASPTNGSPEETAVETVVEPPPSEEAAEETTESTELEESATPATAEQPTEAPAATDAGDAENAAGAAAEDPVTTPEPLFYNLPPTTLTNASILYASPNRAEPVVPVPVPEGERVFIMGRNATGTHLRVVWNTGVGWVPASFTGYNGQRERMEALPIFQREPPACAVPLTTQFGLNSTWTSDIQQRIAVIADLFRSQYGEFPTSHLSLVVNGVTVESSRRSIVEQGQFSLKDVVFSVPQDLQPGDTLGYLLETESEEPLTFMATIFSVPSNCKWDID